MASVAMLAWRPGPHEGDSRSASSYLRKRGDARRYGSQRC